MNGEAVQTIVPPMDRRPLEVQQVRMRAVWTAFLSFLIDVYDLYLPIMILAPAYAYFKPPEMVSPILDSFIFAAALLGRPVGALVFGYYADRLGRKRAATMTMGGAGLAVLLTGLLPGFQTLGILSVVALVVLRFLTGFFAGGQYTGAVTLAMETCPNERRGFYGGLIGSSSNVSFIVMSVLGMVLFQALPPGGVTSAYVQWGWRIPFFIGAIMAFAFRAYMERHVEESQRWLDSRQRAKPSAAPFRSLWIGTLLQGFVLMNGLWLTYLVPAAMVPGLLRTELHMAPVQVTFVMLGASAAAFFGFLGGGLVSDWIGRRAAFVWHGLVAGLLGSVLLYVMVQLRNDQAVLIGLLAAGVFTLVGFIWGSGPHSYLNERFRTENRSASYGIAFSFAIVIPSFFGIYQRWLGAWIPVQDTAAVLLGIGCLVVVAAALLGPETQRHNCLDRTDDAEDAAEGL